MAMIEVRDLTKRYNFGRIRGIENMNFSVEEGELFGFIGPNGAGKSTTIRILMNMLRADSGSAAIAGLSCAKRNKDIKKITGYMPSEVHCYPTVRVGELLDYACKLRGDKKGIWKDLAAYFGLDPQKRFRELSMGNRRKLSIVQAMMSSPRVLILDEPTGGLDPLMQDRFFEVITRAQQNGATVFFSSHNLGEVQKFCTRVALVKNGHIEMMPDLSSLPMHTIELVTSSDCTAMLDELKATNVRRSGRKLSFMVSEGSLGKVTRILSSLDMEDLYIGKPSLEEMFQKIYYGSGEAEEK